MHIHICNRSHKLIKTIDLPTAMCTALTFGGSKCRDLYVTTASVGVNYWNGQRTNQQISASGGSIFLIKGLSKNGYPGRRLNICRCKKTNDGKCSY